MPTSDDLRAAQDRCYKALLAWGRAMATREPGDTLAATAALMSPVVTARHEAQALADRIYADSLAPAACHCVDRVERGCPVHDVKGQGCHECGGIYCNGGWSCMDCACHALAAATNTSSGTGRGEGMR